jgi:sugar lactone lactonase YvrE
MRRSLLVIIVMSLTAGFTQAAEQHGAFVDLGVQLTSMTLQGSTFTRDANGNEFACSVIRGDPAKLLVFDARDGKLLHRLALEGAHGAWNATTASDGSVYVGTDDNGHLYRWSPGEEKLADLGQVAPNQTFVWDLTAGADGEVFVGTYPGCQVIRYHPRDGFSDVGGGSVAPGENYARGITRDPATGKIYVGVGAHARLIELDPRTGEKHDILPKEFAEKKFVYSARFAAGKLFALTTDGTADCLVIDPPTRKVEAVLPQVTPQLVVSQKSPWADRVYVKSQNALFAYDLKTRRLEPTKVTQAGGINAMAWLGDGKTLAMVTQPGRLIHFDPSTGNAENVALKPPREPTPIQSICRGPDGRIYCGGYLVGGLSAYDPATGKHEQYNGMSQAEGMGVLGSRLYLGVYPRARLYAFDTARPWDAKLNNPEKIDELDRFDQDRPFAVLGVESLNKVFFGSVPDYGTLGGALSVYDVPTKKLDVQRNVVQDQGITSLVYAGGLIVGATTRSGGLGIEPSAKEAKLFGWDPASNGKVFELAPLPGAWLITGLALAADGNVWGVADETLFAFDVAKRAVVYSRPLFKGDPNTRHARWRDAFLLMHPDGRMYGTMGGRLFRLDLKTREVTVLRDADAVLLAMDGAGRLYFRDRTHLWQFTP